MKKILLLLFAILVILLFFVPYARADLPSPGCIISLPFHCDKPSSYASDPPPAR